MTNLVVVSSLLLCATAYAQTPVPADGVDAVPTNAPSETESVVPTAAPVDITAVPLYDLLDAPVIVGSRRLERASVAPAVVSVITRQDINLMRPMSMDERISLTPGVELTTSYLGFTLVNFRGIMQQNYNDKNLLVINGHPIFGPESGAFNLEAVPELSIDRIEVVRGPGAVLYGTNAFSGVMNVVTRAPQEDGTHVQATVTGGSMATRAFNFSTTHRDGPLSVAVFGSLFDSDGYKFRVKDEEYVTGAYTANGPSVNPQQAGEEFQHENDSYSVYSTISYRRATFNLGSYERKFDKWGIVPNSAASGRNYMRGYIADASVTQPIGPGQTLTVQGRFDDLDNPFDLIGSPPNSTAPGHAIYNETYNTNKTGGEVVYNGAFLDEKLTVTAGGSYDYWYASPHVERRTVADAGGGVGSVFAPPSPHTQALHTNDWNAYANVDYEIFRELRVDAGLRYNNNASYGSALAPRVGLVSNVGDHFTFKALYGRGYRAPSFFEKNVFVQNVVYGGNTINANSLKPETIDDIDLVAETRYGGYLARLTGFYMINKKLIDRTGTVAPGALNNTATAPQYQNGPGYSIAGIEAEIEARPTNAIRVSLNGTYRGVTDNLGSDLATKRSYWFAHYLGNAVIALRPIKQIELSVIAQLIGNRKGAYNSGVRTAAGLAPVNRNFDPYGLVNAQLTFEPKPGIRLSASGKNLTNIRYMYPEYLRQIAPGIPGGPGRSWYGTMSVDF
jgi:outer membrane receptor for ferrienterochelin and colicins